MQFIKILAIHLFLCVLTDAARNDSITDAVFLSDSSFYLEYYIKRPSDTGLVERAWREYFNVRDNKLWKDKGDTATIERPVRKRIVFPIKKTIKRMPK